jgi:hypothetical protein
MSTDRKRPTAWERYKNRAAIQPTDLHNRKLDDIRTAATTNTDILHNILEMLVDHAANIDALKSELKETKEFMDWAITTHEGILNEYNAVKEIAAVASSTGDPKLDKLIDDWIKP